MDTLNTLFLNNPLAFALAPVSLLFLLLWWLLRTKRKSLSASRGGVVVGGDNSGVINTGSINSPQQEQVSSFERTLGMIGAISGIIGLVITMISLYFVFFPPNLCGG